MTAAPDIPEQQRRRSRTTRPASGPAVPALTVDIAIPVFNEQRALPGCIETLHGYLRGTFPFAWTITIVDNASTDNTHEVAEQLAEDRPQVRVLHLDRKGKGGAVRAAWLRSEADILVYMDVDLSTGLDALLPLVSALATGHSDIAVGSRLASGARITRGIKRELFSRGYNGFLRLVHGVRFTDAQCGFKALRADMVHPLLCHVEDDGWFFDTELLLLAEYNGLRLHEVAVDWVEDVDSRVGLANATADNVRGVLRVARAKAAGKATVTGLPQRPPLKPIHPDSVLAAQAPALQSWSASIAALLGVSVIGALVLFATARLWRHR